MNNFTFFVAGDPKAQPRARAFAQRFGNKYQARVYNPSTAEGWKSQIAEAAKPFIPFKIPMFTDAGGTGISVSLEFVFARPRAHFRSNGTQLKDWAPHSHTAKPDCDNLSKAVLDCLTTLGFWSNDSMVSCLHVRKRYACVGEQSGCQIAVDKIQLVDGKNHSQPNQESFQLSQ